MKGARFLPWSQAMQAALYGPDGFYRKGDGPAAHFRTSVHASPLFATAVLRLLSEVDEALGQPERVALVDLGAGRGELLEAVRLQLAQQREAGESLLERLRLVAVELAPRPDHLTSSIEWLNAPPHGVVGLLLANEWLDNVPCDVAELTPDGWRIVEVAEDGTERLGSEPDANRQAWLSTWWPAPGDADEPSAGAPRAEIGLTRDAAWRQAVATVQRGVTVAVDYAHERRSRPRFGTLTGYARGRQVSPVPDGSCDITAHVALDSCAAAAPADWTVHDTQRSVIHSLGITGGRPDIALASSDPRGYLRALSQSSAAAELTDPAGLGGFSWLLQGVGVPVPRALASRGTGQADATGARA